MVAALAVACSSAPGGDENTTGNDTASGDEVAAPVADTVPPNGDDTGSGQGSDVAANDAAGEDASPTDATVSPDATEAEPDTVGDSSEPYDAGPPLPPGKCENEEDEAALGEGDVNDALMDCTMGCLGGDGGKGTCIATCLQEKKGVSEICASCLGQYFQCILDSCLTDCMAGFTSPKCLSCMSESGCSALGTECLGSKGCEDAAVKVCVEDEVYSLDPCTGQKTLEEACAAPKICLDGECTECKSHASKKCSGGDVYWYDSCGQKEDKYKDCGSQSCSSGACKSVSSSCHCDCYCTCSGACNFSSKCDADYSCAAGGCEGSCKAYCKKECPSSGCGSYVSDSGFCY